MSLNTLAFCTASQRWAVARAAGAEPLTAPPMTLESFCAGDSARSASVLLVGRDLLYFALHGIEGEPYWYGDDYITALSTDAFVSLDLSHTVVFVACCHFTNSPFLPAILACRPKALIAGAGKNFTRTQSLVGAHLLGYHLRRALAIGLQPHDALYHAKRHLELDNKRLKSRLRSCPHRPVPSPTRGGGKVGKGDNPDLEDLAANSDALNFEVLT